VNTVLQELLMGHNNFGNDGITVIARAIGMYRIRILRAYNCDFTAPGAKELATGLSVNQTIKELYISGNRITVKGACLILQSAVDNAVCEKVYINSEYYEDNEVQRIMSILKTRQKVYGH